MWLLPNCRPSDDDPKVAFFIHEGSPVFTDSRPEVVQLVIRAVREVVAVSSQVQLAAERAVQIAGQGSRAASLGRGGSASGSGSRKSGEEEEE